MIHKCLIQIFRCLLGTRNESFSENFQTKSNDSDSVMISLQRGFRWLWIMAAWTVRIVLKDGNQFTSTDVAYSDFETDFLPRSPMIREQYDVSFWGFWHGSSLYVYEVQTRAWLKCVYLPTVMNDSSCLNFKLLNVGAIKLSSSETKLLTQTYSKVLISRENEYHISTNGK